MMPKPIRIVLVDDHCLVLDALTRRIQDEPDMQVVGTALDGEEGLRVILETRPDIAILDVELPGRSAFDVANHLAVKKVLAKIIFLTGYISDVLVEQAVRARAAGYLMKGEPAAKFIAAVRKVAGGDFYYSPEVSERLVFDRQQMPRAASQIEGLTNRQLEVLRYLAKGSSVKEVAKAMHLSEKSVDSHKYRIMHKLGIHDRVELARFAIREGLTLP